MSDMTVDIFAEYTSGKVALSKMYYTSENFRLYEAGWLGDGTQREVMKISGAEFRKAKSGKNAGKLSILIPGTKQTVHVTIEEIRRYEESNK